MSPLTAVRRTTGLVVDVADFVVHHPVRTALRLVGAGRAAARVLTGHDTVVPPGEPGIAPIPVPSPRPATPGPISSPEPMPGSEPAQPPSPAPMPGGAGESYAHEVSPAGHDDRHGGTATEDLADWEAGLDDGVEIVTSAGTTGVAPGINPDTGLPNHAPGVAG